MHERIIPSLALVLALLCGGCMNTPTIPAPPPAQDRFYALPAPDVDGFVTVEGQPGAFPTWDLEANRVYGLVLNLDTHRGVIEPVENDGSFMARIEAQSGHRLNVRTRFPDGTESFPIELVVPY